MTDVILESTLTCPRCGHSRSETMPTETCQWFYECLSCKAVMKPKPGDCCVFCSYGDVPCPPVQRAEGCRSVPTKENIMKKLEVFDPAMCCSTGVCGVEVDPILAQFAADLKWVEEHGIAVERHNLGQEPQAFAANPAAVKEMEAGMDRLPILSVDGHIVATGVYPSRQQLAQKLGIALTTAEKPHIRVGSPGCNPRSGCC